MIQISCTYLIYSRLGRLHLCVYEERKHYEVCLGFLLGYSKTLHSYYLLEAFLLMSYIPSLGSPRCVHVQKQVSSYTWGVRLYSSRDGYVYI